MEILYKIPRPFTFSLMSKQKTHILIPLIILTIIFIYCWIIIITTETTAIWKHYFGLLFFLSICIYFYIYIKIAIIAVGIFLLLGTINLLAFTPIISTFGFNIGSMKTPGIQLLSLCLFILYFSAVRHNL